MNNINRIKKKKALTVVVATVLLLLVSVIAMSGVVIWFNNYSSELYIKSQNDLSGSNQLELLSIELDENNQVGIYVKNKEYSLMSIVNIKVNGNTCSLTSSDLIGEKAIVFIGSNCIVSSGNVVTFMIQTNSGIYEKTFTV